MAQLDQGGFFAKQDDGTGTQKPSAYVYVEQKDLRNKIEHWVLVTGAATGETAFKAPQVSVANTNLTIFRGDSTHQFDSLAAFLDARYHDPIAAGHARRYIKCTCDDLTL